MKIIKHAYEPICAMAIINPQLCKQKSIHIELEQRDEGPIPHLHVYLDKTRNPKNCAYVRLDKAEYSTHHKDGKHFNKRQKKDFIEIMTSIWPKSATFSILDNSMKVATGYQAAVETWKDTFGETMPFKYDTEGFPIMPDYANYL